MMFEKMEELLEFVELRDGVAFLQLKVDDGDVVEWLRQVEDPDERVMTAKRALKVGIMAMSSAFVSGTQQTIHQALERWRTEVETAVRDSIQQSRQQIIEKITEQFGRQITEPVTSQIDQITRSVVERVRERIDDLEKRIDPNRPDSWLSTVQETVDALKEEFDPNREGSYLWRVRNTLSEFYGRDGEAAKCITETITQTLRTVQDTIDKIHQGMDEIKVRLGGTTLQRGRAFEKESVRLLLEQVTVVTGDQCEYVGEDNRPGDWLIKVHHGGVNNRRVIGKIVIEAKDAKLNKNQVHQFLENAMTSRNADIGVLLFAHLDQNPYNISFSVLNDNYSKMVAVWDNDGKNLNFAYQLARLCILEKHLRSTAQVDWTSLRQQIQDIINEVNRMDELERQTRLAKERAEDAEELCREIRNSLLRRITRLQEAITTAASQQ